MGYTPFSVDTRYARILIGEKFPLDGWADKAGKSLASLATKTTLIAILDENVPSQNSLRSLNRIGDKVNVARLGAATVPGVEYRSSAASLARLDPPAYPMFALVEPDGTITKMWLGFDARNSSAFEAEIIEALKGE